MNSKRISQSISVTTVSLSLVFGTLPLPSFAGNTEGDVRVGLPGRRISGGVREGNCFTDFNQSLVAIMPRNNTGKTLAEHPTFWFSIPESSGYNKIEFQLLSEQDEILYHTELNTGGSYGITELQLPNTAPSLALDKNYRWVLSTSCSDVSRFEVQGWVRRVEIPAKIAAQLETASASERLALYRSADLWHEQVTELVNLRRRNINDMDFQLEWAALIDSTGLTSDISSNIAATAMTPIESTVLVSSEHEDNLSD
ncbi:MAG: protein of unknown function (DUF928) [Phormidesmis priestleyi Ana]|uniref:DUF928 domain-containing protein n=1 Tax=Phormidesmis priestleyi Ana TaxID=1666911 RepID=A0A0P7ZKT6_9CYAN|nr:MAG: protein of unknown function (DUF928) [Phormidesmis priestleyi Ana]